MSAAVNPSRSVGRRTRLALGQLASWRPSWRWLRGVSRSFVTSFLALAASLWLLPGPQVTDGAYSVAYLATGVIAVGALIRPLITTMTVLTGVLGLLVFGLLAQALVLGIALEVVPTVEPFSFTEIVLASWAAAVAAATFNWLVDTSSDQVFLGQVVGRAVRATPRAGVDGPGLLVVQLDGVSEPLLRQAITAGSMPTVSRWVRSGSHELRGWHTGVPATTPAGQAVLLHGDDRSVPGFRWYDKEQGRLRAASRPTDAAEIEKQISDGHGLLATGGTSVSNLFSGDAPTRLMTVSDTRLGGIDRGSASFAALRFGFLRSAALFVGQVVLEWHQGRRQRIRDVVPRVHRGGAFLVLRGLTTVILRDLNVAIVAEQMTAGAPVIYVDFVDYDEVAHHAGPTRPESMRTLENLDRVLDVFEQLAREVGRRYELVVLSDHGQAQGSTFLQLTGRTLDQAVRDLADPRSAALSATAPPPASAVDEHVDETWVPANILLGGATASGRVLARFSQWLARGASRRAASTGTARVPAPELRRGERPGEQPDERPAGELLVAVSGSLAHVYRTDRPGRLTREQVDELHPRLVRGLAELPHVGLVLTRRSDGAVVLDGPAGWRAWCGDPRRAEECGGQGADPLAAYGAGALADLLTLDRRAHVGDLVVLGEHDARLGEVVAFEELVGSHGGLGGWQTDAFVVHPGDWSRLRPGQVSGRELHDAMVGRLEQLGLRGGLGMSP